MRPSQGPTTFAWELLFACFMMVFLFTGLCAIFWRSRRRRFDRGWFAGLGKKFLPFPSGRVKCVVVAVEQDGIGIDDGDDFETATAFGEEGDGEEEDLADYLVATGLQSRILFTIVEESKEDLDSDCGRSSRGELSKRLSITRSLSDLGSHSSRRMFDSVPTTPPSKFKFLRDADERFQTRLKLEAEERALGILPPSQIALTVKDDLWLKTVDRRKESEVLPQVVQNHPSSSSRVLPLESSPPY